MANFPYNTNYFVNQSMAAIPVQKRFPCHVIGVRNGREFYFSPLGVDNQHGFLTAAIDNHPITPLRSDQLQLGAQCLVQRVVGGAYFRGRIFSVNTEDDCHCVLLRDYLQLTDVKFSMLCQSSDEIESYPRLWAKGALANVSLKAEYDPEVSEQLKQLFTNRIVYAEMMGCTDNGLPKMAFFDNIDSTVWLYQHLIDNNVLKYQQ